MNNRSIACLLLCPCLVFAQGPSGAFVGRGGGGPMAGHGRGGFGGEKVVTGAPFTGVEVRTFQEQLANGNVISRTSQTTLYRDSEGRTRSDVTVTPAASTGKPAYTITRIADPVAGVRYELDSSTMTAFSSKMMVRPASSGGTRGSAQTRPAAPATRTGRNGAAVTSAALGSQVKNGVLATGTQQTEVIAAGKIGNSQPLTIVRETWMSTDLKRPVEVKITDPEHGNSTMELTNLIEGEPNASLFAVPSGYAVKSAGRGGRGGFVPRGRPGSAQ